MNFRGCAIRKGFAWSLIVFAASCVSSFGAPADFTGDKDATGVSVHVSAHPQRIVTLMPSVAELAAEILGLHLERIVGVSEGTDYPPALQKLPSIGTYQRFDLEKVIALKPDLVLATLEGNSKDQILHLRELGIPVFVLSTNSFTKISSAMEEMGRLLGEEKAGQQVAAAFNERLEAIRTRGRQHARESSPHRVLIQLDTDPLIVAGGGSFLNEALNVVGAQNAYSDIKLGYPHPSLEDALTKNPDTILIMAFGSDLKPFQRMAISWSQYPKLSAVQKGRVQIVDAESLLRPSMRLIEGLGVLDKVVYGK